MIEIDEYEDSNFPTVRVSVKRPKSYGPGYACEHAIRILLNVYYRQYGKEFKK